MGSLSVNTANVEEFRSKKIKIDLDALDPDWCEDDSYRIFYNTLNAAIPAFVRYVIRSLRAVREDPRLEGDERLRKLIDVFIRQEAEHSRQHVRTNWKIGINNLATLKVVDKITTFAERVIPTYVALASSA